MRKTLILIAFLLMITILTGCSNNSVGIDDYYFVIGIGLDEAENNYINLSIQIPSNIEESSNSGSSQSSSFKIYSANARTVEEAMTLLDNYLNKQINLSHCSAIIVSESLARKGISNYINSLNNNIELRYNSQVIISSSTAREILEKVSNSGEAFSARLYDYLKNTTNYTGFTVDASYGNFSHDLDCNYTDASAIYTEVNGDIIQSFGIAIFKDYKFIGHLDVLDSISHLIVTNKLNKCSLTIDNPFKENAETDFDVNLYKNTKTNISIINGSPFISLEVFPEISILSSGNEFDYTYDLYDKRIVKSINTYLEKIIKKYLYTISKKYSADIASFQGIYKSSFLTEQETSNYNWNSNFKNSFFEVKVNSRIASSNLFKKE